MRYLVLSLTILIILTGCQVATTSTSNQTTAIPTKTIPATATDQPNPSSTKTETILPTITATETSQWIWVEATQPSTVTPLPTMTPSSSTNDSLRNLADAHNLNIGVAVNNGLVNEAEYAELLGNEFNIITAENAMKFGIIHPQVDSYDFVAADEIVNFALAHHMQVRGHTLVWQKQMPKWLQYGDWTSEQVSEILYQHIQTVVGRYRGQVQVWDVVNEGITGQGILRNFWYKALGPEYIDLVFQWAHEADPDALLFYNDYSAETINKKSDKIHELLEGMLTRGIPVHGVGLQFHVDLGAEPRLTGVAENIKRLNDLGLQVHITELDVSLPDNPSEEDLFLQAETYRQILGVCLAADNCNTFIMWGMTDKYSWIPSTKPGSGAALIFDENYQPKPAYFALQEVLKTETP